MRKVVVTGIGLVSPLAATVDASWEALVTGKSGIRTIPTEAMDTSDLATTIAGIVPLANESNGLNIDHYVEPRNQHKMGRFIHLGIAAAHQAVNDSKINLLDEAGKQRVGVFIGSGIGGLEVIEANSILLKERGPRRISPYFIPASLINLTSGHISIQFGFKGPNCANATACSTGAHAIGDAARMISLGVADVMVAGGTEAAICRLGIAGFNACRALSTHYNATPEKASRPFDKGRDGFVMGEGAGVLILEELEHARKRGIKIYAEIAGYGLTGDAHHITAPSEDGDGGYRSMRMAIEDAKLKPEDIDYINAHGTSTPRGDLIEVHAVKRLFGSHANKLSISSTKSSIGHLLGAAGSVEAIFSILAIQHNLAPPTLNLDEPDNGCDLDFVPHKAKHMEINTVLSNSFAFGGTNASLVIKRVLDGVT